MPNLGIGELVIILLIVLVAFGAKRLPELGSGVGKAIRNLKRGLNTEDDIEVKQVESSTSDRLGVEQPQDAEVVRKPKT